MAEKQKEKKVAVKKEVTKETAKKEVKVSETKDKKDDVAATPAKGKKEKIDATKAGSKSKEVLVQRKKTLGEFSEKDIDPELIAKFKGTPAWDKIYKLEQEKHKHWVDKQAAKDLYAAGINIKKIDFTDKTALIKEEDRSYIFNLHSLTLLSIFIVIALVLTWIFKGGALDESNNWQYVETIHYKLGLFDFFRYVVKGFVDKSGVILMLMSISAYMGVLLRTGALQGFCDMLYSKWGNKRGLLVGMFLTIALLTSIMYSSMFIISLAVIVIPFVIALGYTMSAGIFILLIGTAVGMMGSTFNTAITREALLAINDVMGDGTGYLISAADGLLVKVAIFAILAFLGSIMLLKYERRIAGDTRGYHYKKDTDDYIKNAKKVYSLTDATVFTKRRKIIMLTFPFMVIIGVIGMVHWQSMGVNNFYEFSQWLKGNELIGFIYGQAADLGTWGYSEISILILTHIFIISIVAKTNQFKIFDGVVRGVNAVTPIALFIVGAGAITAIFKTTGIHYTLLHGATGANVSEITTLLVTYVKSMLTFIMIPFEADVSKMIAEIIAPSVLVQNSSTAYQALVSTTIGIGIGTMFVLSPTSPIVFGVLITGKVSWFEWVKSVWKYVVMLSLAAMAIVMTMVIFLT